ncbi:MAG: hypothetical protein HOP08_12455 [Cyclobacteriaceae bacterium]|nr:hypothetical protein [Cyclobacteriaceae bacterium]
MSIENKKIAIKDLLLWDENARFPDKYFNSDQSDLIHFFVAKSDFKIKQLVEEIVKDLDLPQLEKLVVWSDGGSYIVLEGNRRLAAYKILSNPELVSDERLNKYLFTQSSVAKLDSSFLLECIVTDNKNEGFRYIDRKHANNNNEVNWQDTERSTYKVRRGSENHAEFIKIGIARIVRQLDIPEEMKDQILGKGYVTTFFRLVTTGPAKAEFRFEVDEKGALTVRDVDFKEKLKVIIHNVLRKKDFNDNEIDSRSLNKTDKIESYIKSVKIEDAKKVDAEIKNNTVEDIFGNKTVSITPGGKPPKATDKPIALRSRPQPTGLFTSVDIPFRIGNSNLRLLYEELRDIDVAQFPNATHDLLRSFLECSLIAFFKKNNEYEKIQKNAKHNPTLGEMLSHIVNGKCTSITDQNLIETIDQVKTDYDKPYSLERLHMINHNENWVSTERDVRVAWAKLEGLFKILLGSN